MPCKFKVGDLVRIKERAGWTRASKADNRERLLANIEELSREED